MATSKWWWIGAFVVVDLILLLVVRAHLAGDDPTSPPPSAGPVTDPAAPAAEVTPLLAASGGDTSVWSSRGDCRTGTDVTLSRLAGDDLATLSPGVAEVLRLDVTDAGDVYVVGATADCQVVERVLEGGSDEWRDAVGEIVLWHLVPEVGQAVVTPAATADPGCVPVTLAQDGDSGRVACADGTTRVSDDEGRTWQEIGRLEGLQTAAIGADALALAPAEGCPVAAFTSPDGGATWQQAGCVSDQPGTTVAVSRTADATVAVLDDRVLRSTDAGTTWETVVTNPQ